MGNTRICPFEIFRNHDFKMSIFCVFWHQNKTPLEKTCFALNPNGMAKCGNFALFWVTFSPIERIQLCDVECVACYVFWHVGSGLLVEICLFGGVLKWCIFGHTSQITGIWSVWEVPFWVGTWVRGVCIIHIYVLLWCTFGSICAHILQTQSLMVPRINIRIPNII